MFYLCAVFFFCTSINAKVLEKIYATVNSEVITTSDIELYQNRLKKGGLINDMLYFDPEEVKTVLKNKDLLIKKLVDEKIIDSEIKKSGLTTPQDRVQGEISSLAKRRGLSKEQLVAAYKSQGILPGEYTEFIKKSIERRSLIEKEIASKIKISEQDIVSFYLSQPGNSKTQVYEYNLAHILLPQNEKPAAQQLLEKIRGGLAFDKAAQEYSRDKESLSKNADFGKYKSGEMLAPIERAIAPLSQGDVSEPVETPMGVHLFKVTEKSLVKNPRLEKEKEKIFQILTAKAFKDQLDFWLSQKRKEAHIHFNE
jgi:peptidyl-prolyl cis-trans isomerase SurA